MADVGQNPGPLEYMPINRVISMNSDGSYPDQGQSTPTVTRATAPGNVPAGCRRITIRNSGNANGVVLSTPIKPAEQFDFSVSQGTLGAVTYDGTGTELVVIAV